jgi:PIN domain nuclease of toxin-antitoxin system
MRLLLDTHLLLWALDQPTRIDQRIQAVLKNTENEVLFSAASLWEIAIKAALRRADFMFDAQKVLDGALASGFIELPIRAGVTVRVADLPLHHRDPFDRLLIAQAIGEPARFYTADPQLAVYSDLVTLVSSIS